MAFMKKKPPATELSIDFYTQDKEKLYVANKRLAGIDKSLTLLQSKLEISEDDGLKKGGSYTVKLTAQVRGKDVFDELYTWRDNFESKDCPPWWWGVEDQTEPTAPWWGKE